MLDYKAVADDYADVLNWVDEYCRLNAVYISGRGGRWKVVVPASHDRDGFCITGNTPLEVMVKLQQRESQNLCALTTHLRSVNASLCKLA
jgi:hypothetical protein